MAVMAVQLAVAVAVSAVSYAMSKRVDKNKRDDTNPISQYGDAYNFVVGTMLVPTVMTWAPPLIHRTRNYSQKGFGQKVKEHSYYLNAQLVLAHNQTTSLFACFNGGKKIYTNYTSSSTKSILASLDFAKQMRFYKGTDDQLPDPLIEAYEGSDNVSAMRGKSYIVLEEFAFEPSSTYSFEAIVSTSSEESERVATLYSSTTSAEAHLTYINQIDQHNFKKFKVVSGNGSSVQVNFTPFKSSGVESTPGLLTFYNRRTGLKSLWGMMFDLYRNQTSIDYALAIDADNYVYLLDSITNPNEVIPEKFDDYKLGNRNFLVNKNNAFCFYRGSIGGNTTSNVLFVSDKSNNKLQSAYLFPSEQIVDIDVSSNYVFVAYQSKIVRYTKDLQQSVTIANRKNSSYKFINISVVNDDIVYCSQYSNATNCEIGLVQEGTYKTVRTITNSSLSMSTKSTMSTSDGKYFTLIRNATVSSIYSVELLSYTNTDKKVSLAHTIKELVKVFKAKNKNDELLNYEIHDVSDLEDIYLDGYVVGLDRDFRSVIEDDLKEIFFFDLKEDVQNGKITYVKRKDKKPIVIIPQKKLNATLNSNGDISKPALEIFVKQDSELFQRVILNFRDKDADYRSASTSSSFQISTSNNTKTFDANIAFNRDDASTFTYQKLIEEAISRETYKFFLSEEFSYLNVTDVIQVQYNDNIYTMRIRKKTDLMNGIYELECVATDSATYEQKAVGAPIVSRVEDVEYRAGTDIVFLDTPLLRDQDEGKGVYYAVGPDSADSWRGAVVQTSLDGGTSFIEINSVGAEKASCIGYTLDVLGDCLNNEFDFANTVTVKTNGVKNLTSTTVAELKSGYVNVAYIGGEIVQFLNATPVTGKTDTYKLSGFYRGLKGTEKFKKLHKQYEKFVLIEESKLQLLQYSTAEFDSKRVFQAITYGDDYSNAKRFELTFTGQAYECYSPVHCGGGFNQDGAILKWVRRGRINNGWLNKVDVPLSEASEKYEVDILRDGNVVRTLTSNTQSVTYSNAQMVEDFGAVQNSISFNVYQLSELRSRGEKGSGIAYR